MRIDLRKYMTVIRVIIEWVIKVVVSGFKILGVVFIS